MATKANTDETVKPADAPTPANPAPAVDRAIPSQEELRSIADGSTKFKTVYPDEKSAVEAIKEAGLSDKFVIYENFSGGVRPTVTSDSLQEGEDIAKLGFYVRRTEWPNGEPAQVGARNYRD